MQIQHVKKDFFNYIVKIKNIRMNLNKIKTIIK